MNSRVQLACEKMIRIISLADILPMRKISKATKSTMKYRQVAASIREVGVIEPLVVHPQKGDASKYMLLDRYRRRGLHLQS
jgi:ParB-like chromosome segregation protein Spo0J